MYIEWYLDKKLLCITKSDCMPRAGDLVHLTSTWSNKESKIAKVEKSYINVMVKAASEMSDQMGVVMCETIAPASI